MCVCLGMLVIVILSSPRSRSFFSSGVRKKIMNVATKLLVAVAVDAVPTDASAAVVLHTKWNLFDN